MGKSVEKKRSVKRPPIDVIAIVVLLIIPSLIVIGSEAGPGRVRVGIMMTDDRVREDAEIAKDAFNDFHGIFDAIIVDELFNESGVRQKNGLYLTNDYHDIDVGDDIRRRYDVDIVLIITFRSINNWLGSGLAHYGHASMETSMAMMTTKEYVDDDAKHMRYIQQVSVHEVLHLLGYEHHEREKDCIMVYGISSTELCSEDEMELDLRASFWKAGAGKEFSRGVFVINLLVTIIIAMYVAALLLVVRRVIKRYLYKGNDMGLNPMIFGAGTLIMGVILVSRFRALFYGKVVFLLLAVVLYALMELGAREMQRGKTISTGKEMEKQ